MTATTTTARRQDPSDEPIRWTPGERLHHLVEAAAQRYGDDRGRRRLAVDGTSVPVSYTELIAASHGLARRLVAAGVTPGDRVGVLVGAPSQAYAALLAVSVAGATAVPMDPAFPDERLRYIADDADLRAVLVDGRLAPRLPGGLAAILVDQPVREQVTPEDLDWEPYVEDPDPIAYIVYTSGSTGRPKGVMVAQSSICNFLRVAADCYGFRPGDRVYQGLTIAFDFSVEEIWVPLVSGATLVPRPAGPNLVGTELRDFLVQRDVSALCCVPTLLSTITDPVESLRLLLVSGEACPPELAHRWLERGVRMLNVYGPTETTVTATWAVLHPDEPLTIGHPLPTYSAFIVDRATLRPLPAGEAGELAITGPGVALGYLNRPDLTSAVFVDLETPSGLVERGYLTGDLARIGAAGAIEYLGRVDSQVKLRGYRIELAEIESVLLDVEGITAAVVDTVERDGVVVDLAAYLCGTATESAILAALRSQLPAYMVPAYVERLDAIPVTTTGKLDRAALPAPRRRGLGATHHVAARNRTESLLAETLAEVLRVDQVSVSADFFTDLGADSLLMAAFLTRLREHDDLPPLAIRDPYTHRSVTALAAHLDTLPRKASTAPAPLPAVPSTGRLRYAACGAFQLMVLLGWPAAIAAGAAACYDWTVGAAGATAVLHLIVGAVALTVFTCLGPVAVHRVLVGRRNNDQVVRLWSLRFLRYWTARHVLRFSPLGYLTGTALQLWFLRLLGARIGRGVVYLSRSIPSCPDQIAIGAGTVISKDVHFVGLAVERTGLRAGPTVIGKRVYVGAGATLDIDTSIGDGAQLGHASSLHRGQRIPAGERWHGSPAAPTSDVLRELEDDGGELASGARAVAAQAVALTALTIIGIGTETALGRWIDAPGTNWTRYVLLSAFLAAAGYLAVIVLRFLLVAVAARSLGRGLVVDHVYPRRGAPWLAARLLALTSNSRALTALVGDSSYAVAYAGLLGYRINYAEQTGSTFGMDFQHEAPDLVTFGDRSMASDGLSILNIETTATTFRLRRTSIGADCYLGNAVIVPPGASVPDNCLLATKVMLPVGAELSSGVGLLGSPAFEIPRSVARDTAFDDLKEPETRRALIGAKNRYNLATIALALAHQLGGVLLAMVIFAAVMAKGVRPDPLLAALGAAVVLLAELGYEIAVERLAVPGRSLRPDYHSIYDVRFWRHERMWKLSAYGLLQLFAGTAVKPVIWRMLGVRVGRRLYDGGCLMPEKTLVTIGDHCILGEQSTIQCHSLEDATFKSAPVRVDSGCVIGDRVLLHYGTELGEGAVIQADAFVMKGERVPAGAVWVGNPAGAIPES